MKLGMGGLFVPALQSNEHYYLISGDIPVFDVSKFELRQFFAPENVPALVDGKFRWSEDIDVGDL